MITMLLTVILFGGPVFKPGELVRVPDHFYRRVESVEGLPKGYHTMGWGEGRFGSWLEATMARGPEAVETIQKRLGPPTTLPVRGASRSPRQGYVFPLKVSDEAGLIILVDRRRSSVDLHTYRSDLHPLQLPIRPPSHEWEANLMRWFHWLTTPDAKLSPALREAARDGFPPFRVTGVDPITGQRE